MVEGDKFGFELIQLILLTPCLSHDTFKNRNIGFEFSGIIAQGDNTGESFQSVIIKSF